MSVFSFNFCTILLQDTSHSMRSKAKKVVAKKEEKEKRFSIVFLCVLISQA